jgi:hypothetical protein
MLSTQVEAQSSQSRGRGLYGDWKLMINYDGRSFPSILSFSRDKEGKRTTHWISIMGLNECKDVSFEDGKLSFATERRNREGQISTTKFAGKIEKGKLTGTLTSDRGEYKVEGGRMPRMPRAVGSWQMKFKVGERDITTTLIVKADEKNKLAAEWQSQWGEHTITDINYERGNLNFKRKSTFQDRQWESTFEGTIDRETDTLSGVISVPEMGEIKAEGTRIGSPLIGDWNLETTSERGTGKQRLRVNPDMSGLYGAIPIKKVHVEEERVDFLLVLQFGDRTYEMTFDGKLEDSKLTGEMTSEWGTQKVKGTKIIRTFRRRGSQ